MHQLRSNFYKYSEFVPSDYWYVLVWPVCYRLK